MKKAKLVPKRVKKTFSVDDAMLNLTSCLVRDFRSNLSEPTFCSNFLDEVKSGNIGRIRELAPAPCNEMSVAEYKATYQIGSVLKRYRFRKDVYSDQELIEKATTGFRETQDRLAALDLDALSLQSQRVLDLAACYVAKLLGPYSDKEHRYLCRFGTKASVGISARDACEAARWELPISGSKAQISWFHAEMRDIDCIQEYWVKQILERGAFSNPSKVYHEVDALKLTLVPKTFKAFRAIMPNTTIGSYMSYGLGEMIRKRLKRNGYDIRSLQQRHRYLASEASIHQLNTTADLSSASDSITVALVKRLFPPDWFDVLDQSRIGNVTLPDGTVVQSLTHCTMGVGYTFPLQTLVFLSLLKAIQAILFDRKDRRTISVYGDDLIYSSRMHADVVRYFQQFGFVFNLDKTFHEGHFRESCGGDYFRGVDVRPFQPRNGSANVGPKAYEAVLYKWVNGLLARWTEYEVERTLGYLIDEIESVAGKCKLVPGDFPDDSGIKCPTLTAWTFLRMARVCKPKYLGSGMFRFSYLRFDPELREELRHEPYYWLVLRGGHPPIVSYGGGSSPRECPSRTARLIKASATIREAVGPLQIKEVRPTMTFWSEYQQCRLRQTSTYVTVSHTGRYTRQSGVSCFEHRR